MVEGNNDQSNEKGPISATDLRKRIADHEFERARKNAEKAREADERLEAAYTQFMKRTFSEEDRQRLRDLALRTADRGELEMEIIKFPSAYLEDHGRKINNATPDWPTSLTGYAKSCYEAYLELAEPQGFKMIARVLNYPDGMIGDIALYVSWRS